MSRMLQINCPSLCLILLLVTTSLRAQDGLSIEELWSQWNSGDEAAYERLAELGPEARQLADRILLPDGAELHAVPKVPEELLLLLAMRADAAPALSRAIANTSPMNSGKILDLFSGGPLSDRRASRPVADSIMEFAVKNTGRPRQSALKALAAAEAKRDFVIPSALSYLKRSGSTAADTIYGPGGPNRVACFGAELLQLFPDTRAFEPLLEAAMTHPSPHVRSAAMKALVQVDRMNTRTISCLIKQLGIKQLGDSEIPARMAMFQLCGYRKLPAEFAVPLITNFYKDSFEGRYWRTTQLSRVICRCHATGEEAKQLVNRKLRRLLLDGAYFHEDIDPREIRVAVAIIVLKWNPGDQLAAKLLANEIQKPRTPRPWNYGSKFWYPDVRARAAAGIGQMGSAAKQWLPVLRSTFKKEFERHPTSEFCFDLQIDSDDQECVQALKESGEAFRTRSISESEIRRVLGQRVAGLIDIGKIQNRLRDPDALLQLWTVERDDVAPLFFDEEWLQWRLQLHPDLVVPILIVHSKSANWMVRRKAVSMLGKLQSSHATVVPTLVARLKDERAIVRAESADALAMFGTAASEAETALRIAENDHYLTVRVAAEDALIAIHK